MTPIPATESRVASAARKSAPRDRVVVGLLGCGTVGSGVVEVLQRNREMLEAKIGCPVMLKQIAVRDPGKSRSSSVPRDLITTDAMAICRDPEIDVVIELVGGLEPARAFITEALKNGKTVVTANKACLATYWDDVVGAARESKADLYIEAAVCAGIPVIQGLKDGLAANRVRSLLGILNGTCNYILTRMTYDGWEFDQALREAQGRGYAEADPTLDIEGQDTAQKLAILASLGLSCRVRPEDVHTEGITALTKTDIQFIRDHFDSKVKLLAIFKQEESDGPIEVRVHPCILSAGHLLAAVDDAENAVWISGDVVGSVMFFGPGAGSLPTASAVVSDLVSAARDVRVGVAGSVLGIQYDDKGCGRSIKPMEDVTSAYYFRVTADDSQGLSARVSRAMEESGLVVSSVFRLPDTENGTAHVVVMTEEGAERNARRARAALTALPGVRGRVAMIRTEREGQYSRLETPTRR